MNGQRFWLAITGLLVLFCAVNIYQNFSLTRQLKAGVISGEIAGNGTALTYLGASLAPSGRILQWPDSLEVMAQTEVPEDDGYQLVLAFSEQHCDHCRDRETQFIAQLARELDPGAVRIVVHAAQPRYVRAYMSSNGIELPVWYDRDASFFMVNELHQTPILLMVNERDEVIAASTAITDQPWISEPFHDWSRNFLSRFR